MGLALIIEAMLFLCLNAYVALSISLSKPGCPETCGNVKIPYPFGIGPECSENSSFTLTCSTKDSRKSPRTILEFVKLEVLNISLAGTVIVNQHVSPLNCSGFNDTSIIRPISSLVGSPFTVSAKYNTVANFGCRNMVLLRNLENTNFSGACVTTCAPNATNSGCNGVNCCQVPIFERLQNFQLEYASFFYSNSSFCGYSFLARRDWFLQQDYNRFSGLQNQSSVLNPDDKDFASSVPLVLEWEAYNRSSQSNCTVQDNSSSLSSCNDFHNYPTLFRMCSSPSRDSTFSLLFTQDKYDYKSTVKHCHCNKGFQGNPYLDGGCSDIDECSNATLVEEKCGKGALCYNSPGSFTCSTSNSNYIQARVRTAFIVIGSVIAALVLLYGAWRSGQAIKEVVKAIRRYMFYKHRLEQRLASTENGLEKTKVFPSKELSKATDHYNANRILGHGGQGTVYKGMLADGKIVAVKKSKKVNEDDLEAFISEVVILSQINHRNIVKLIGCGMETDGTLLVYEYIPNGTLFHHIHEPSVELSLTWEMRVRIATEVAGALAYLHSASSVPIYHRDVKSTNILLDDKYRAKVSDFGTSRSVAIDQTHVTTRVIGTYGYMDPEYFQSSQFTEKSDVYSFGVVLVELLTGKKAITSIGAEAGKSLATLFLQSTEKNQVFDILDARVLKDGKAEEIMGIAELARRCLNLNGNKRPTMKEAAVVLEAIQRGVYEGMASLHHEDHNVDNHSVELYDEAYDSSSISENTYMGTTATATATTTSSEAAETSLLYKH